MAISVTKTALATLTKADLNAAILQYLKANNVIPTDFTLELLLDSTGLSSAAGSAPAVKVTWNPDS